MQHNRILFHSDLESSGTELNGRQVCLELELKDRNFIYHKHPADGRVVFTVPPKTVDLPVDVIYADSEHLAGWYMRTAERKGASTLLFMVLCAHCGASLGSIHS